MASRAIRIYISALAGLRVASGVTVDIERAVYVPDEAGFEALTKKYTDVLVMFGSKSCKHCASLVPTFEKVAKHLRKQAAEGGDAAPGPKLAKIDVDAQKGLADKHEISELPAVVLFRGGQKWGVYFGSRTKRDMLTWMDTFVYPAPVGAALRQVHAIQEAFRMVAPTWARKYSPYAPVAILAVAILLGSLCASVLRALVGARGAGSQAAAAEPRGRTKETSKRPGGRSASPGPTGRTAATQGAENADQNEGEEENAKSDAPVKEAEEKKDD